jgi:D-alanyl-D-alanine carboxypeptidase/D-alanyl-D-alanine-endopeptidase (penicillin-binding protein 4)
MVNMKNLLPILLLFTFIQTNAQSLKTTINTLAQDNVMTAGQLGVCVMNASSGEIIANYNSAKAMIPASTMKTVTTATAVAVLGANYQFKTTLEYDGIVENGILKGNLYLKGTGDPMFGSDEIKEKEQPKVKNMETVLSDLLSAVRSKGITKIEGKIIGDDAYFNSTQLAPATWQWNDLGNYYGSGASALNFHENLYYIYFSRSKKVGGSTTIKRTEPEMPYLVLQNEVTLGKSGSGDNAYIFGSPNTYQRYVRGTIPIGKSDFKVKGSFPNPAYFAAYSLMSKLEQNGIKTSRMATTQMEMQREGNAKTENRTVIYTHKSPLLKNLIKRANEKSNNLYCEALLKAIGKKLKDVGSTKAGIEATLEFWKNRGFDVSTFFMEDGSGLSARNAVSPFAMASLMSKVSRDKNIFDPFYNSLPIGGKTGTVKYMFRNNKSAGSQIHVKSGSIRRVRAYCGYAKTKSGKLVAFCIMANNFTGKSSYMRTQMEKVMIAIANLP